MRFYPHIRGRPAAVILLALVIGGVNQPVVAQEAVAPAFGELRLAAEQMGRLGVTSNDPVLLIGALSMLLEGGATLDADDPWDAARYMSRLQEISAAQSNVFAPQIARLAGAFRGTTRGPSRFDIALEPGENASFTVTVVGDEFAIIEARLKQGSDGGDIDMVVANALGAELGRDTGPGSGVIGIGTYFEFIPQTCQDITISIENVGSNTASVALIAPPSLTATCER